MSKTNHLIQNALIAALYMALTLILAPISYGPIQIRLSEFMTLLAFLNPRLIPGLVIGCFLANLGSPFGAIDMFLGTLATFLSVYTMRFCPTLLTASLMPVLFNGMIIGCELLYLAALPADMTLWTAILYIGLGEFLSVSILGMLVIHLLLKNPVLKKFILNNHI
jgi:uncharacterized membrane protein